MITKFNIGDAVRVNETYLRRHSPSRIAGRIGTIVAVTPTGGYEIDFGVPIKVGTRAAKMYSTFLLRDYDLEAAVSYAEGPGHVYDDRGQCIGCGKTSPEFAFEKVTLQKFADDARREPHATPTCNITAREQLLAEKEARS